MSAASSEVNPFPVHEKAMIAVDMMQAAYPKNLLFCIEIAILYMMSVVLFIRKGEFKIA